MEASQKRVLAYILSRKMNKNKLVDSRRRWR